MAEFIPVPSFDLVVFGATGDLSLRKLFPALLHRFLDGQIPAQSRIIGVARTAMDTDGFRALVRESRGKFAPGACVDEAKCEDFLRHLEYVQCDASAPVKAWAPLREALSNGAGNVRIFYLSTAPQLFVTIAQRLAEAGLAPSTSRIVLEKPIGRDLESSRAINDGVGLVFDEHRTFRIDHYLGKETVQNLLVLRFANGIFEPLWNQKYIDHVQITVSESLGVEDRGGYYDTTGALRDMIQNHLLQLLTLTAMEPPGSLRADALRNEKMKVLETARPYSAEMIQRLVVRGQYSAGAINDQDVPGYRHEPRIKPDSTTETFVAMQVWLDNWRWAGVPFYLRSGKRLLRRTSEIAIQFKPIPQILFRARSDDTTGPNMLVLRIQPDEGASLTIGAKVPGLHVKLQPVQMDFHYGTSFGAVSPEAYERLLRDVMVGDRASADYRVMATR